jgi:hypothetical protein
MLFQFYTLASIFGIIFQRMIYQNSLRNAVSDQANVGRGNRKNKRQNFRTPTQLEEKKETGFSAARDYASSSTLLLTRFSFFAIGGPVHASPQESRCPKAISPVSSLHYSTDPQRTKKGTHTKPACGCPYSSTPT